MFRQVIPYFDIKNIQKAAIYHCVNYSFVCQHYKFIVFYRCNTVYTQLQTYYLKLLWYLKRTNEEKYRSYYIDYFKVCSPIGPSSYRVKKYLFLYTILNFLKKIKYKLIQ